MTVRDNLRYDHQSVPFPNRENKEGAKSVETNTYWCCRTGPYPTRVRQDKFQAA